MISLSLTAPASLRTGSTTSNRKEESTPVSSPSPTPTKPPLCTHPPFARAFTCKWPVQRGGLGGWLACLTACLLTEWIVWLARKQTPSPMSQSPLVAQHSPQTPLLPPPSLQRELLSSFPTLAASTRHSLLSCISSAGGGRQLGPASGLGDRAGGLAVSFFHEVIFPRSLAQNDDDDGGGAAAQLTTTSRLDGMRSRFC